MSRGGYTAAIDMWSLGCIFGELLQRIAHVGSAATPNLQARLGRGGAVWFGAGHWACKQLNGLHGNLARALAGPASVRTWPMQVAPLFAIHGLPKTPEDGESFLGGPGNEMTRSELQASQ